MYYVHAMTGMHFHNFHKNRESSGLLLSAFCFYYDASASSIAASSVSSST